MQDEFVDLSQFMPELDASHRCDRCQAQAYVRVMLTNAGELLFCNHHYSQHELSLLAVTAGVQDERWKLTQKGSDVHA